MLKNQQPTEKQVFDSKNLQVNSIFYTVQGEGIFVGRPAVFLRLAGCNLQCKFCDTEYTTRTSYTPNEVFGQIIDLLAPVKINKYHIIKPLVVITGGEPFRQDLKQIIYLLLRWGIDVQIETNGTLYQDLPFDKITVICSPKTGLLNKDLFPHIDAFKYVIHHSQVDSDGLPLHTLGHPNSGHVAKPRQGATIFVQPADEKDEFLNKLNNEEAVNSAMQHGYILGLQTHKYLDLD